MRLPESFTVQNPSCSYCDRGLRQKEQATGRVRYSPRHECLSAPSKVLLKTCSRAHLQNFLMPPVIPHAKACDVLDIWHSDLHRCLVVLAALHTPGPRTLDDASNHELRIERAIGDAWHDGVHSLRCEAQRESNLCLQLMSICYKSFWTTRDAKRRASSPRGNLDRDSFARLTSIVTTVTGAVSGWTTCDTNTVFSRTFLASMLCKRPTLGRRLR